MDFNTGRGGGERPDDDQSRPLYSGRSGRPTGGGPTREPAGDPERSSGGEFNLQDPINSFINTARRVLLEPTNFFRGIARQGDFLNPAIFALICALISALLSGILSFVLSPLFAVPGETDEALAGGILGFVLSLILSPIYTAIALIVGAAIYHLLVLLFVRPGNAGFEATFRVVCYVAAIQLVSWIPIVNFIAGIYGLILSILGIREVHRTTTGRAAAIVLIPVAVILLLVLIVGAALVALFIGDQQLQ